MSNAVRRELRLIVAFGVWHHAPMSDIAGKGIRVAEETVGTVRRAIDAAASRIRRPELDSDEALAAHDREVHRLRYETPFYAPGSFPLSPESEATIDKLLSGEKLGARMDRVEQDHQLHSIRRPT